MHGEVGALRRRKSRYKKPAPPPPKCSDLVRAATGKDLPEKRGKRPEGEGEGGGGEEAGKPRGRKGSLFSLSGDFFFGSPKRKQKKGGKEEVLGGRKKKRGNE